MNDDISDDLDELLDTKPKKEIVITQKEADQNLRKIIPKVTNFSSVSHVSAEENTRYDEPPSVVELKRPISVQRLSEIFDIPIERLKKRLKNCKVHAWVTNSGRQQPLYDFREACEYFLKPRQSMREYIESVNPATLPAWFQVQYWSSQKQRAQVMKLAGQLWHDADVQEILGRTAIMIRDESRLWIENLPDKAEMTDAQYNALSKAVSELLESVHERLVEQVRDSKTLPFSKTIQDEMDEAGFGEDS